MLMREPSPRVLRRFAIAVAAVGMLVLIVAVSTAQATVSISRAELSGTKLRIEGQAAANGSISIIPGGNGNGRITSQPAGIDCTIIGGIGGTGACSAFFPTGTVVRLDARPAADSRFQGWRGLPGCGDPSKITVAAGTNISCQPGFQLK